MPVKHNHSPDFYPFQIEGAAFLSCKTRAMLGFDMGLGKTATAILAADQIGAVNVLMVCQGVARINHVREWLKWQTAERTVDAYMPGDRHFPITDVVIVSYEFAASPAGRELLGRRRWDLVVLDEAHKLKNPEAKRTFELYGKQMNGGTGSLLNHVEHAWLLTGTPAPNGVHEMWTHLRACGKIQLSWMQFIEKFCQFDYTPYGIRFIGQRNLEPLRPVLENFLMRVKKKDVLKDLPPIRFDTVLVSPEKLIGFRISMTESEDPRIARILAAARAKRILREGFTVDNETRDQLLADELAADSIATSRLQRLLGEAKAPAASAMLVHELEADPTYKVVVFFFHTAVGDYIQKHVGKTAGLVRIDGKTPAKARQPAIDRFQQDPHCRVLLAHRDVAGTSITATAAHNALHVEPAWVPGDNAQAAARLHRIGQTMPVVCRFLVCEGSIDEIVMRVVADKTRRIFEVEDLAATPTLQKGDNDNGG